MPNDLSIAATTSVSSALSANQSIGAAADQKTTTAPDSGDASSAAKAKTTLEPSPLAHLNPALGIVVLEFFNSQGDITSSIPTQKQLDAFQQNEDGHFHTVDATGATG